MKFELFEKFRSTRKSIADVKDILSMVKDKIGLDEMLYYSIYLCVYEIFINAVFHGNKIDPSKYVELYIVFDNNILTIDIVDQGEGFVVEKVPNPLTAENILRDSGRGIFIATNFADSIKFQKNQRGFCSRLSFDISKQKQNKK
jgi:serine/threonine-protein kinase RsbW